MEYLFVQVTTTDRRVVLHERHPAHPGGEAWLGGDGASYIVGDTPAVRERIADGRLALVAPIPADVAELAPPPANSAPVRSLETAPRSAPAPEPAPTKPARKPRKP